ncbi:hypothetical protein LTR53_001297 [Teratosphaeriaceae sp. CCFEE 6253]|nr:hypothetical protein LTR53_001297 [Teratosphaeriaceae sp. CCFEE 6253]
MAESSPPDVDEHGARREGHEEPYFDFFALPRELRDWIYDLSTPESQACVSSGETTVTINNGPSSALLSVNQPFAHEYGQRAKKAAVLRIEADGEARLC